MFRLLRFILKEIAINAAINAVFTPGEPTKENFYPDLQETTPIENVEALPDYDDILAVDIVEITSSFSISEQPIYPEDIEQTFLGQYDGEFSTLSIYPYFTGSKDTLFFDYRILLEEGRIMKQGNGAILADENYIEIDQEDTYPGMIYKVNDSETGKKYVFIYLPGNNDLQLMYIDTQLSNLIKP